MIKNGTIRPRFQSAEIPEELNAFRECLQSWDWYYSMSDDHSVWMAGGRADAALQSFLNSSRCTPAHRAIYDELRPR